MQTVAEFNETATFVQIVHDDWLYKVIGIDGVEHCRSPYRLVAMEEGRTTEDWYAGQIPYSASFPIEDTATMREP